MFDAGLTAATTVVTKELPFGPLALGAADTTIGSGRGVGNFPTLKPGRTRPIVLWSTPRSAPIFRS